MTTRPNVLILMADQMTSASIDLIAQGVIVAPNLAGLIERSVSFSEAYCAYPLCSPSRASLMSGRLPSNIGAYDNGAEFPAAVPTIAHYLRNAGYDTKLVGKMHFLGPDQLHGFENRLTPELYPCDFSWTPRWDREAPRYAYETGAGNSDVGTVLDSGAAVWTMQMEHDEEVALLARQQILNAARSREGRPWMMTTSFTSPHDPFVISQEYLDLYHEAQIPMPTVPALKFDDLDEHSKLVYQVNGMGKYTIQEEETRRARHAYFAMISYVDAQIGKVLQAVEETGETENTVVVFTSDHGEMLGERGMWFKKTFFEPSVRVPLLFSHPGRIQPRATTGPVSLVDVLPTLLDLTGADGESRSALDGSSLAPGLLDPTQAAISTIAFVEGHDNATVAPRFMVRDGDHKLVYCEAYPTMLFNLRNDPLELENLAGQIAHSEIENHLRNLIFERFDVKGLREKIIASQNDRRLVTQALSLGITQNWKVGSTIDASSRFVLTGDAFPDVERRGYVTREAGKPSHSHSAS
ncbi:choline-sulfatase [Pseudarthrobacter raffinosi]|uniref:choline-sulfatase n=1 Tax=Pseudarthrobacter raffinosi TaxID=2953651 RepID=UPI00208E1746|nr:choline-sulfatase [Pseudarthrobacter sp. MDT3-9]MCO4252078.1 choline-sulfatase [Pseudarthrobacter sp. MDT3-9]